MAKSSVAKRAAVLARVGVIGLFAGALVLANDPAEAARKRHKSMPKRAPVQAYSPPYSAIVVDAKTGRVLFEADPDGLRHPASITKVMTLYLLFEELEAGRLTVDSRLSVSSFAAMQAPTKLGLRPGSTLRVEDAIKGLVTKSANDAAVVIAENIAGSEEDFAERMTRKARALGMTRTVYRNASGLPNNAQVTTARDLAILSRAIQDRFPRYYGYFSIRSFAYAGRVHGNHNKLLGRVDGVDGIKTGYTRASGFNLATSVKANDRHIVGVVLGGRSGASRDAKMRELIALNLPKASPGNRTAPLVAERAPEPVPIPSRARPAVVADVAEAPASTSTRLVEVTGTATPSAIASRPLPTTTAQLRPAPVAARPAMAIVEQPRPAPQRLAEAPMPLAPPPQPVAGKPALPMPTKTASALASLSIAPSLRWVVGAAPAAPGSADDGVQAAGMGELARSYAAETSAVPPQLAAARSPKIIAQPTAAPIQVASAGPITLPPAAPAPVSTSRAAEPPKPREGWFIQIAATPDEAKALELLNRAKEATSVLRSAEPFTEPVAKDDVTLYRARFAGLDKRTAQLACDALKRADMSCFAIRN